MIDMKLSDVVKLIRGKPGTVVRLDVIPAGGTQRKLYKITREKIELKDSEAKGEVFDAGREADGTPYRVGVIDLPSFYRDMAGDRRGAGRLQEHHPRRRAISSTTFNRQGRGRRDPRSAATTAAGPSTKPSA